MAVAGKKVARLVLRKLHLDRGLPRNVSILLVATGRHAWAEQSPPCQKQGSTKRPIQLPRLDGHTECRNIAAFQTQSYLFQTFSSDLQVIIYRVLQPSRSRSIVSRVRTMNRILQRLHVSSIQKVLRQGTCCHGVLFTVKPIHTSIAGGRLATIRSLKSEALRSFGYSLASGWSIWFRFGQSIFHLNTFPPRMVHLVML